MIEQVFNIPHFRDVTCSDTIVHLIAADRQRHSGISFPLDCFLLISHIMSYKTQWRPDGYRRKPPRAASTCTSKEMARLTLFYRNIGQRDHKDSTVTQPSAYQVFPTEHLGEKRLYSVSGGYSWCAVVRRTLSSQQEASQGRDSGAGMRHPAHSAETFQDVTVV